MGYSFARAVSGSMMLFDSIPGSYLWARSSARSKLKGTTFGPRYYCSAPHGTYRGSDLWLGLPKDVRTRTPELVLATPALPAKPAPQPTAFVSHESRECYDQSVSM